MCQLPRYYVPTATTPRDVNKIEIDTFDKKLPNINIEKTMLESDQALNRDLIVVG